MNIDMRVIIANNDGEQKIMTANKVPMRTKKYY